MKICGFCGNKNLRTVNTQYIYKHSGSFMFVNNVPCVECEFCGEQYFHASVLKKIETDYRRISGKKKKVRKSIRVPVEEFAAIK